MADTTARRQLVLLVEDHQDTRLMYAEFLGDDFEVMTAPDGDRALEIMRSRPPDLIVTDMSLPGMNGVELVARVRGDALLRAVPVICLSGHPASQREPGSAAPTFDRVLQKPCMPDRLAAVVSEVLRDVEQRRMPS